MIPGEVQQQPQAYGFANPMTNLGSTVLLLTNPDEQLDRLEMALRCLYQDSEGTVHHIKGLDGQNMPPLLNEYGVASVISTVRTVVSRVTVMSNLEDKEIEMLMLFLADTLARDLMMNRMAYGLHDPTARDKIFFDCLTQAYVCLKRALKEGDRRFLKGSAQEITTTLHQDGQGQGMIGKLLGWKK